jgi:hypothetical protein
MARFATNPTEEQLSLLKRMVRYYKGTASLGIKYQGNRPEATMKDPSYTVNIIAYSDSAFSDNNQRCQQSSQSI